MQLHIVFDIEDHTLYAELQPDGELEDITELLVAKKLEEAGHGDIKIKENVLSQLKANFHEHKACKIALTDLIDATVSVVLANDKLKAFLTITPARGGHPLTLEKIRNAITEAGIVDALVDQAIVTDCLERQSATHACVAQARMPVQGKDAEYVPLVESLIIVSPNVDEHDIADMGNTHRFLLVEAGTPLMKRIPATEGEAGMDVTGQAIRPHAGKDSGFAKKLSGVALSADNPNILVAAIKGHPVIVNQGVNVDPVLHVDNVDVHTGNIKFDGSLEVKGDVAMGMIIEVTGDVCVRGAVERATIRAGQHIRIGGGILGGEDMEALDDTALTYLIQAGGDIEAKFVNLSTLYAKNNILIKEYLINSYVKAGNQLLVGHPHGKGVLFGGKSEAANLAVIKRLGNETYMPAHVSVGELSQLYTLYQKLQKEIVARSKEVVQLENILTKMPPNNQATLGQLTLDKAAKIENTIIAIKEKIARIQQQLHGLEPAIALQKKASIKVTQTIYPNAVMTINETSKRFTTQTQGSTWVQLGNELVEQKLKEASHAC